MFGCPAFCVGAILAARPSPFSEKRHSLGGGELRALPVNALLAHRGALGRAKNSLLRVLTLELLLPVALVQVALVRPAPAALPDADPGVHHVHIVLPSRRILAMSAPHEEGLFFTHDLPAEPK
jgi:hypothetical protein